MTEAEWHAASDPAPMLEFLRGKISERKSRLFACSCIRAVTGMPWEVGEAAKYVENYCDGLLKWPEVESRLNRKVFQCRTVMVGTDVWQFDFPPLGAPAQDVAEQVVHYCLTDIERYLMRVTAGQIKALLRDIFGNPFRPITLDPTWRTSAVLALASGIYDDRAFDRLPILADALQDAGCDHPDILAHCRNDGPHARGCWVVDLILGKS